MMTPQLQEALEWVNHLRTGPLDGLPLGELPKGVPGHTKECVIARALKMGIVGDVDVLVNTSTHMVRIQRGPLVQGSNPSVVREVIEQFDAGNMRDLIDYDTYRRMDPNGNHMAQLNVAKPFDKLLPKLAQFCPELKMTQHSHVEVSQSFDTMMSVVTVKNPGECPKSLQLTATMVQHMQKMLEQEMEKALYPPMVYDAGKLSPLKPGSIINMWEPVEFKPAPTQYYAPDWAKMMQTPEAPVMAPKEELAVV